MGRFVALGGAVFAGGIAQKRRAFSVRDYTKSRSAGGEGGDFSPRMGWFLPGKRPKSPGFRPKSPKNTPVSPGFGPVLLDICPVVC